MIIIIIITVITTTCQMEHSCIVISSLLSLLRISECNSAAPVTIADISSWIWTPSKAGNFTFSSAWNIAR